MTESEIKENWYYFRSLAKQFQDTEQFVDHSIDDDGQLFNGKCFSNEFAKILLLASSEFEVIAKELCKESGLEIHQNDNIIKVTKKLLTQYPKIKETIIQTPYNAYKPLKTWKVTTVTKESIISEKLEGLSWWSGYNEIKHNRSQHFDYANLQNCLNAMSSLMILELYLSQKVLGNVDKIKSLGCAYFDCDYGLEYFAVNPGNKLPDFNT